MTNIGSSISWKDVTARWLERQFLSQPAHRRQLTETVSAICGLQAQVLTAAGLGIGARVSGLTHEDIEAELWEKRSLVKSYTLRGTLHVHPSDDLPLWLAAKRALMPPPEQRWKEAYQLEPDQAKAVLHAIEAALDGQCLTREELAGEAAGRACGWARERLASTWADLIALGAESGVICFGPNRGSKVTFVRPDQWIAGWKDVDPDEALRQAFRRYFAAYGPSTVREFTRWLAPGNPKVREVDQRLSAVSDELEEVSVEGQRAWILAADASAPRKSQPGSVRLLPQYDSYILGCRFGREHIVPDPARKRVFSFKNGRFEGATGLPILLIDGVVSGMWERSKDARQMEIRVEPFVQLTPGQIEQIEMETARIGEFFGANGTLVLGALG